MTDQEREQRIAEEFATGTDVPFGMRFQAAQDIELMMARLRIQKTSPAMVMPWIIRSPGRRARPRGRAES